jgi:hypothetical protein
VRDEATLVDAIYTSDSGHKPSVSLSPPRSFTVGGTPAVQIVATVTDIETNACTGSSALHSMLATTVPGIEGTVVFVVSLQQAYPGAPDRGVLERMVITLRRAERR